MALQKDTALKSGVSGNYCKIMSLSYNGASKKTDLVVSVYKDAATRALVGSIPLSSKRYAAGTLATTDLAAAYTWLKTQADFAGATDC